MRTTARRIAGLVALAVLGVTTFWAVTGLRDFGHPPDPYATEAVKLTLSERHVTNTVAGTTFDLRGFDTLGEELILFCAAIGATMLLRLRRGAEQATDGGQVSDSLRALAAVLVGPVVVFGVYVVAHGHLTPGGGFQGGVILAAALLLAYAAGRVRTLPVDPAEVADAVGAAAYALVAIGGMVFATVAMANFLGFGSQGSLLSGGMIPILNVAVGVEVSGALTLILLEFLTHALRRP
jgi:multicomponent Na+:H+ antiporter subunit B